MTLNSHFARPAQTGPYILSGNVRTLLEWADGLLSNDEDGYVGNDVVEKDVFFDCVTPALTAYLGASPKKLLEPGRQR